MIYISGKITGENLEAAKTNFKNAEIIIEKNGGTAINPMEIIEVEENKSWENYMKEALYVLLNCTEIYMLENWTESRGAKIEHAIAKTLKYKIRYK